jgi:predicted TIM-barrel fold metal-dependent hydrolase
VAIQGMIDFHTHAFPDALAERAMAQLLSECDARAWLDGRLGSLLESMDRAGIETSVLCCIATKPSQYESILKWCLDIRSDRIIPMPSVHPDDPQAIQRIEAIRKLGFKGIKLHPYYQGFQIDDPRLDAFYKSICENELLLIQHTGFDIAFEWKEVASPAQILRVLDKFPDLRLITTHMGSWFQWDEVEKHLIGRPVYMETSMTYDYLGPEKMKRLMEKHPPDYLFFGSDSPWDDQSKAVQNVSNLIDDNGLREKIFRGNAVRLLGL